MIQESSKLEQRYDVFEQRRNVDIASEIPRGQTPINSTTDTDSPIDDGLLRVFGETPDPADPFAETSDPTDPFGNAVESK